MNTLKYKVLFKIKKMGLKWVKRILLSFSMSLFVSSTRAMPVDRELVLLLPAVPADSTVAVWSNKVLRRYPSVQQHALFKSYSTDGLVLAYVVAFLLAGIRAFRNTKKNPSHYNSQIWKQQSKTSGHAANS